MLAELGTILTGLALAAVVYAAFATYWSIHKKAHSETVPSKMWAESGRNGIYAAAALLGLAVLALLTAFLDDQFQIEYVAQNSSRSLPFYLKASAIWGGQDGSLLLWSFLQALFAAALTRSPSKRTQPLIPWALVFLNVISAFFVAVTLFLSNPFALTPTVPADGLGLNPLLRHPGMIFHPPAMYLGYVGLAVPFALAMAALVVRRVDDWPVAARSWTLAAWLFLGLGLLLGMRWAYDVLGWGGYWGWDPVENAGLMPWLTATALLHGLVMQERGRGFRWWNTLLVTFSFILVLFGTFTTRSGLIQSVHAFARSPLGFYFLGAIIVALLGSLALLFSRRQLLKNEHPSEDLLSQEGMFILTVILFLTITASVLVGSVLPTLTDALSGQAFEAGPEWFDRVTGPQFAALVLVMGVCPLLGRVIGPQFKRKIIPALIGGALLTILMALVGLTRPFSLVGFALVGMAGGTAAAEIWRGAAARSRKGENIGLAIWRLFGRNRRRYGGYLVHLGVILMAIGVIGTRFYPFETEVTLKPGQEAQVGDYVLVYEDLQQSMESDHSSTAALIHVYRRGDYLRMLTPQLNNYINFHQTEAVPAVRPGLREDLYLVLAGWGEGGSQVTIKVIINALASFLWLGGLVFLVGGGVALWPSAQTTRMPQSEARRRRAWNTFGLTVGVLLLSVAVWAMWGTGQGTATGQESEKAALQESNETPARPRVGEIAPDFTVDLMDGSSMSLSDLRGQTVVVNFWATWCSPCESELPAFQAVWDEYQEQDVAFIGLALQEDQTEVQDMASKFNLTYPLALDPSGEIAVLAYGVTGVPETFIVDAEGQVAHVHIGPMSGDELRQELDSLLE